ncbi:glycosyltransferase family protein [Bacillus fungorum]|uniref:glycosyltransferase family protein n=1 Tax=Bacillus fungorum TaxID=2039284 RepID=UPI001FEC3B09|nr:glycosyltransferase family protein [Bacillus fungorum]
MKKKISFISCVNNFEEYNTALNFIHALHIPENCEIEIITIKQANSLTSGYNQAMKKSNAKYKVYLHQDTYILNKNFIYEIIRLFEMNPKLGMLGVIGAKTIPNGVWWASLCSYGTVYHTLTGKNNIDLMAHRNVTNDYESVLAVDGLIMVTQYDLEWREDLFQGWHFYDISQCLEFVKAGYEVGVPRQRKPWCLHDTGITNVTGYEEDRKIFVENYRNYIT